MPGPRRVPLEGGAVQQLLDVGGPPTRVAEHWVTQLRAFVADELVWDATHRALASHPAFAHCSRREIRRIARAGDLVEIGAGEELWRPGQVAYWFLAVLAGGIEVGHGARRSTVGPGGHVGMAEIIGFAPQTARAVTAAPVVAFVLGRRELLGMVHAPSVRRGVGLPVDADGYRAHVRAIRAEGEAAWRALPKRRRLAPAREGMPASFRVYDRRRASELVLPRSRAAPRGPASPVAVASLSRRAVATLVAVAVACTLLAAIRYHPPVAFPTAVAPVDVGADIAIDGAPQHALDGRYLLLAVRFRRPSLLGVALGLARGERTVPAGPTGWRADRARSDARAAFERSRVLAVAGAVRAAGLDPAGVQVRLRDRTVSGASAGLLYALAVRDALDVERRACGRTIAATGVLDDAGGVGQVRFVDHKVEAARRHAADVVFVPTATRPGEGRGAIAVATVDDAVRWLAETCR